MDVLSTISTRRSIRAYKEQEIEEEKLNKVLEAGRLSPSANNKQDWKFILVKDKSTREKLAVAARGQSFIAKAPVILVVCTTAPDYVMTCGQPSGTIDLSIAMSYMILEAWEQGLGTCWLGAFYEDQVKNILHIPDHVRVVAMTPLGYPDESPSPRPRKPIDEIVCYERY